MMTLAYANVAMAYAPLVCASSDPEIRLETMFGLI